MPGGLANVCLVTPDLTSLRAGRDLASLLIDRVRRDPILGPRFLQANIATRPIALGPLAVDSVAAGTPGLLLAGDAAGFIDPMTGDGLRVAMRGGELAARAALLALHGAHASAHDWLARERRREFLWKQRFNRTLRAMVAHPRAVAIGSRLARAYPGSIRHLVRIAGDVGVI